MSVRVNLALVLPLLVCDLQDPWSLVVFEHATDVVLVRWRSRYIGRYTSMSAGARALITRGLSASSRASVGVCALFVRVSLCG